MAPRTVVYLGDRFLAPDEPATVSLFDRGYLLGDSVFASLRVYDGRPFGVELHLARLADTATELGLACPSARDLEALARAACAKFGGAFGYLRVTLSRGEGSPGLGLGGLGPPLLSVVVRPLETSPFPEATAAAAVRWRAPPASCADPAWKLGSYAMRVVMRREVEARGHREGFVFSVDGELVSGVASNVFVVRGPGLVTPPLASGCRPGITRGILLGLLARRGVPVEERPLSSADVHAADGAFFASALTPVLPVQSIEGRALDPGASPILAAREAYAEAVEREVSR